MLYKRVKQWCYRARDPNWLARIGCLFAQPICSSLSARFWYYLRAIPHHTLAGNIKGSPIWASIQFSLIVLKAPALKTDSLSCIVYVSMTLKRQQRIERSFFFSIFSVQCIFFLLINSHILNFFVSGDPQGRIGLPSAVHVRMPAPVASDDVGLLEANAKWAYAFQFGGEVIGSIH